MSAHALDPDPDPVPAGAPGPAGAEPSAPAPLFPVPAPEPGSGGGPESGATERDMGRLAVWVAATFRPPDVWAARQPSAAEEVAFVRAGGHLPEKGLARTAALAYAWPVAVVITALLFVIWVVRSPARGFTAALVAAVTAVALHLTL